MSTEKTTQYFLQWRGKSGYISYQWEDYYGPEGDDAPDGMLESRNLHRQFDPDYEYRVIRRTIEIAVIDSIEDVKE